MSPTLDAFLRSWPFDPWLLTAIGLAAGIYLRGWMVFRRRNPQRWPAGRLIAYLGGLAAVYLALASPIEPFADLLLQVHMLQHLLLMMAAPPLLWLGQPAVPLMQAFRSRYAPTGSRPCSAPAAWAFSVHDPPGGGTVLFVATTWPWHAFAAYELAPRLTAGIISSTLASLSRAAVLVSRRLVHLPAPARRRGSCCRIRSGGRANTVLSAC